MPDRKRFRYIAFVELGIVGCLTVIQIGLSAWSQYVDVSRDHREYRHSAEADQKKAAEEIARRCNLIFQPGQTLASCIAQEMQAYQKQDATNKDLKAQQDMALWSLSTFLVGAGGLVISIGGLVMLWVSLNQTRQAISTDRQVGHAQVRAYISAVPTDVFDFHAGEVPRAEFNVVNSGQSPAYNVRHIAILLIHTHPMNQIIGEMIVPAAGQVIPTATLSANGDYPGTAKALNPVTKEEVEACLTGDTRRLFIFGRVFYDDVFGKNHETKFCASAVPDLTKRKIDWDDPNRGRQRFNWEFAPFHNEAN